MSFEIVRDVIAENLGCELEAITPQARLAEDLGADSLASVELMMALEEATGVAIDDEALPNIKTVSDIMHYVNAA